MGRLQVGPRAGERLGERECILEDVAAPQFFAERREQLLQLRLVGQAVAFTIEKQHLEDGKVDTLELGARVQVPDPVGKFDETCFETGLKAVVRIAAEQDAVRVG